MLRSLEMHRRLAGRLDDELVASALRRLERWVGKGNIHPRYADRWHQLLTGDRAVLAAIMREDSQEAADLRSNTPFAGEMSSEERWEIWRSIPDAS